MFGLLDQILCWVKQIGAMVLNALIDVVNLLVVAVAALIGAVLTLLPNMPAQPPSPSGGVLGALNWVVPLDNILGLLAGLLVIILAMQAISIALRWVKAL
jgi:hypothetical protein